MSKGLSRSLLTNILWSFMGRFSYLVISLITNIILVRLLGPKEFGQLGIIMFFIIVANVLTESGLSGALVRKQNVTDVDYSTIFFFNLAVSLLLMFVLIATSGHIANFYNDIELKDILTVTSFVLFINALTIIQKTRLVKELQFKKKSAYEICSILLASFIAVALAYNDAGVWALVALQLLSSFFIMVFLWMFEGPLKIYKFSKKSFREFYKFGVNTTLASLLNTAFDNIYQLVLGKYFSIYQTGLFYQAKKLQEMPTSLLDSIMQGVVYSVLSKIQHKPDEFNALYQHIMKFFTIIVALICLIIFCYADSIIALLYGEQWAASAIYLKLLIIAAFFYLQEMLNRVVFKIFNRTEQILRLELLKKLIQSITIAYGIWTMSIENLLYGFVISSIVGFIVNYYFARRVQCYFKWIEVISLLKVIFISFSIAYIFSYFGLIEKQSLLMQFVTIPFIILIYCLFLQALRVIDLKKELLRLIDLIF